MIQPSKSLDDQQWKKTRNGQQQLSVVATGNGNGVCGCKECIAALQRLPNPLENMYIKLTLAIDAEHDESTLYVESNYASRLYIHIRSNEPDRDLMSCPTLYSNPEFSRTKRRTPDGSLQLIMLPTSGGVKANCRTPVIRWKSKTTEPATPTSDSDDSTSNDHLVPELLVIESAGVFNVKGIVNDPSTTFSMQRIPYLLFRVYLHTEQEKIEYRLQSTARRASRYVRRVVGNALTAFQSIHGVSKTCYTCFHTDAADAEVATAATTTTTTAADGKKRPHTLMQTSPTTATPIQKVDHMIRQNPTVAATV